MCHPYIRAALSPPSGPRALSHEGYRAAILRGGVNRFLDRRIWPNKAHGIWIFVVSQADLRILRTLWIVDQL